mmetsp:Transcript_16050/g.35204  ORF Transcript_16050/g.35204 Transcript_16050/m.35204 type:complete len:173 (+) Transcript_16050:163-681(+)
MQDVRQGILGTNVDLNALDATIYMSLPAVGFLLGPIFLVPHPVGWPDQGLLTDWQIFLKTLELSPGTIGLAVMSGVLALCYNILQFGIVQSLSATHTAFAGNFNKAATIALALCLQMERLPDGIYGVVMLCAVSGSILAFTSYNIVKIWGVKLYERLSSTSLDLSREVSIVE